MNLPSICLFTSLCKCENLPSICLFTTYDYVCMHVCWDLICDDIVMCMFASTVCPVSYLLYMYKSCICTVFWAVAENKKKTENLFCGACSYYSVAHLILWRMAAYAPLNSLFCGARDHMRHRISLFCGARPVRHRISYLVAQVLWRTAHAPQKHYFGAPQKPFSIVV